MASVFGDIGELEEESKDRISALARFSFARGGQGLAPQTVAALERGALSARKEAKSRSLEAARKYKVETDRLTEEKRANEANEDTARRLAAAETQKVADAKAQYEQDRADEYDRNRPKTKKKNFAKKAVGS